MKKLSLLLALLLLGLTACQSGTPTDTTDSIDTSTSNTSAENEPSVSFAEANYNGYEFRIIRKHLGYSCYNYEYQAPEEQTAELLNDAVYARNMSAEEKYNIEIKEILADNYQDTIRNSILAGDNDFDVSLIRSEHVTGVLQPGMFLDFNEIPNLNLDQPWWDQNARENFSVNGKLYSMTSDMSIMHYETAIILFYNQKLAEDNKLPDLYQLVRDGKWTIDKYAELTANIKSDLNGDTKYDANDLWPLAGWYDVTMPQWFIGGGVNYVEKDDNGELVLAAAAPEFETVYTKVVEALKDAKVFGSELNAENLLMFNSDQLLFFSGCVGEAKEFRDMPSDFGVIPAPKLDAAQENYCTYTNYPMVIMVPSTAPDKERTGAILEWLSYKGSEEVIPKFYETMIQTKYLRDEESVEMMDEYIASNLIYNIGCDMISKVLRSISRLKDDNSSITTFMASVKTSIENEIQKYSALFE